MNESRIRVLVIEDNAALMANISEFLGDGPYALDFASDGLVALHLVTTNPYDVIVMDIMLPGMSGFVLCQRIRNDLHCATPIIMMTAKDHIDDKVTGFSQGADDYLVKPFHLKELAVRIQALHRRGTAGVSLMRAGSVEFEPGTLRIRMAGGPFLQLSGMSAHITEALIRAYPNFIAYEQLSHMLWGDKEVEPHTLRTHIYTLRKLLDEKLCANLIKTLHGRGYRLSPPDEG